MLRQAHGLVQDDAAKRLLDGELVPGDNAIHLTDRSLQLSGDVESGPIGELVAAARAGLQANEPRWITLG